ncbi:MAG: metal ABC transporter ATP-binding protein [Bacillota bacterium]
MNALEIKNLYVEYGNNEVLEDINLKIKDKHFLGIIGPNGGGKSTLLKAIVGLIDYKKGEIYVYGKNPKELNGDLGYVPQASQFDKDFPINVEEVVLSGVLKDNLKIFKKYNKNDYKKAKRIMKKLDIFNLRKRQIGQLSGGQLQKVLLGRALMTEPKMLLLDEPTASIDASSTTQIYELLNEINKDMTIIIVSHNMEAVASYLDSVACLNKKLYHHHEKQLDSETVKNVYGCPVDLIAHGIPHRVLGSHPHKVGEKDDRSNN